MTDRFTTSSAHSYSSGTQGRSIANVRTNHFVIDDADYNDEPNGGDQRGRGVPYQHRRHN